MTPGTHLGPYRVESLIGSGGMGEVYLGTDTRLDRQVAIKVLQGALAKDPSLRERFEREARTISSLSHPNICTLFDLGRHEGSDYLVMEYLQGETLADRIARGPLPPQQVIRIGLGIAAALEAAHRQGIVHRDLKPGNVMLTKSGVKLLDFGLAKLSAAPSSPDDPTMIAEATAQKPLTEQGAILGTFQYMAPEQLEGHPADARTDIFAFGSMLYEMATGRRAFQGATKASLIAAILDRDPPPMTELQPLTPPPLERVVRACLAKDPNDRIQTAHDVALQLKWMEESSSAMEAVSVKRKKNLAPWIAAALLALAAIAFGAMWWRERAKPAPAYTLSLVAPRGLIIADAAISPDGRSVAMITAKPGTDERVLWVRRLDDGTMRQIATDVALPFWSPDSQWIGYSHQYVRIVRVRVDGGQPETIARSSMQGGATWAADGTIVFTRIWGEGLSRVPASGGEPQPLTRLDAARRESAHLWPRFIPGTKQFLFTVHTIADKRNEIWSGSLDGSKPRRITEADALIGYAKPYLLTVRDGGAYAQRFDPRSLTLSGEPHRVVDGVGFLESDAHGLTSLADDGALLYGGYRSVRARMNVYERSGALAETIWEDQDITAPDFSPDGTTMAVIRFDPTKGAYDVYSVDLTRKVSTRLTGGLANYDYPRFSPDGQNIAYNSDRGRFYDVYLQPTDGSPERVLWKDDHDKWPQSWSPDGKLLLTTRFSKATRADIWVFPIDGGNPWPFVQTETHETYARFSPDGKWVAYISSTATETEVFLRAFPRGRSYRVSTDGGGLPSWSADGRELVWKSKNRVMSAAIDLSAATPRIGKPQELFQLHDMNSAPIVRKDGRIAVIVPAPGEDTSYPVHYTTAWRAKAE